MEMTNCTFYGTDAETFYVDSTGQAWLIQSMDGGILPLICTSVPTDAVELSDQVLDDQHHEDAEEIEAQQQEAKETR